MSGFLCASVHVCVLPVLAVNLIRCQGVVKHQDLVGVLQARPGVLVVLQLYSGVQQRQIASDDQGVWAVCGDDSRWLCTAVCISTGAEVYLLVCNVD